MNNPRSPRVYSKRTYGAGFCLAFAALVLCVVWLTAPSVSRAQDAVEFDDIVLLSDGGFVRGTLVEQAVGEYAVLLTRGGQLRRFEAAELRYAGPAKDMPQAESAAPAVSTPVPAAPPAPLHPGAQPSADTGQVHFASKGPLEVFQRTGVSTTLRGATTGESYAPLCTAPCSAPLAAGEHTLALAQPGGAPLRAGVLHLKPGARVEARYESRHGLRAGGWVLMVAGPGAGLALMLSDLGGDGLGPSFWAGCAVSGLGGIVGAILAAVPDAAEVRQQTAR